MPSKKRVRANDQSFRHLTIEGPPQFSLSTTTQSDLDADNGFTEAVNRYLAPEDKVGPSNSWPNHALDRDSRALRAYYRALAIDRHLGTQIEQNDQRCLTSRIYCQKELWDQKKLADFNDNDGIDNLIKEAVDEYAEESKTVAGKLSTKLDFLHMQLLCQQSTTATRIQQIRLFNTEKLFVLESEERQRVMDRLEACESRMTSHNYSSGKEKCRCSECRKDANMIKAVKERASVLGSYRGVPFKSRSENMPLRAALAEHDQLLKALVKDVHTLNEYIIPLPDPLPELVSDHPKKFTFMTLPVPSGWPKDINIAVKDLEHILYELDTERSTLIDQRDEVRRMLLIGMRCGDSFWFEQTEIITDYPDFQRYEYTRNSVLAMFIVWRNVEEKIHNFVRKERIKLSGALSKGLGLEPSGIPEWRMASWEESFATMKTTANSVDDMLRQCKESRQKYYAKEDEEATAKHGEWWKVLVGKSANKKLPAP
ncbi:MAG: hypothetical protein M1835_004877 [Candelina submexicana]|nr:MAG: hypothetical protein M1835_004877 [Candelina submexicana]